MRFPKRFRIKHNVVWWVLLMLILFSLIASPLALLINIALE